MSRAARPMVAALAAALTTFVVFAAAVTVAGAAPRAARPVHWHNPLRDARTGRPLSCPDPTVSGANSGRFHYVLFCTSDNARNVFPIWRSTDLVHWVRDGFVFPYRHTPSWAQPADGRTRAGIFWAPSVTRLDGRWAVYFSAVYRTASHAAGSAALKPGTMVLGVATSTSLAGPWHSRLIHYPGQLNAHNPVDAQERTGGDIDPAPLLDPRTHRWYLFWAEQREQIWESELSSDGQTVGPDVHFAFGHTRPWECDPHVNLCTVEGPQPFYHDGAVDVLYSGASTWDETYSVGVATAPDALDPAHPFAKDPNPILRAGNGFLGPGGTSAPIAGPDGREMILFHALTHIPTSHASAARELMLGTVTWVDGLPLIQGGVAR